MYRHGPLRSYLHLALYALAVLLGACSPRPSQRLRVEYAGCRQVLLPGPACVLDETNPVLRLWVGLPPKVRVEIEADGRTMTRPGTAVSNGQRFRLKIPPHSSSVSLRASTPGGEARWSLSLAPFRRDEGIELHKQGLTEFNAEKREEAKELLARAAAAHHAAGSLLAELKAESTVIWIEIQDGQLFKARQAIDRLRLPAKSPAEAVFYRRYYAGMLAQRVGDARSALDDLTAADELASRVGLVLESFQAEELLGRELQALGRSSESVDLFGRLQQTAGIDDCDRAELLINQGWSLLLAGEAGQHLGDPIPLFKEASGIEERQGPNCNAFKERILGNFLNLALAQLQAGRLSAVPDLLSKSKDLDSDATLADRLWRLDLEARLDLAEGHAENALSRYQRLDDLAARALAPDIRWRAVYGKALCERDLHRPDSALNALREADGLLENESLQVPIQEGRERFLAQREEATGLHLELLLASGRQAEALEVARRTRSRWLRQLARGDRLAHLTPAEQERWAAALDEYRQQRRPADDSTAADWALPEDQRRRAEERRAEQYAAAERSLDHAFSLLGQTGERDAALPQPQPGEVTLAYHPVPGGWVGFSQMDRTVTVHRFDLPPAVLQNPGELATRLLVPFHAEIEHARRVRVLPYGPLQSVDFHALPFDGDVLLAGRPVIYGLDLVAPRSAPSQASRRALVVADPLRDLPEAAREGKAVASALRAQQPAWSLDLLQGPSAAVESVKRSLAGSDLFHYAGHGIFAGAAGWGSDLTLAGGTRLTVGDLLALRRVPRWVVLAGCETGRSSAEAPIEGLGLAPAFVLAGSSAVVAATRPVDDRATQAVVVDLYQHWEGAAPDLALLLQRAQLSWRRRDPAADWASFRLLEP